MSTGAHNLRSVDAADRTGLYTVNIVISKYIWETIEESQNVIKMPTYLFLKEMSIVRANYEYYNRIPWYKLPEQKQSIKTENNSLGLIKTDH